MRKEEHTTTEEKHKDAPFLAPETLTIRQYAAIHLLVPDSGDKWLDDMIVKGQRLAAPKPAPRKKAAPVTYPDWVFTAMNLWKAERGVHLGPKQVHSKLAPYVKDHGEESVLDALLDVAGTGRGAFQFIDDALVAALPAMETAPVSADFGAMARGDG